jgi:hypothetical protein
LYWMGSPASGLRRCVRLNAPLIDGVANVVGRAFDARGSTRGVLSRPTFRCASGCSRAHTVSAIGSPTIIACVAPCSVSLCARCGPRYRCQAKRLGFAGGETGLVMSVQTVRRVAQPRRRFSSRRPNGQNSARPPSGDEYATGPGSSTETAPSASRTSPRRVVSWRRAVPSGRILNT